MSGTDRIIHVEKVSEAFIRAISFEDSVREDLSEYFTFTKPNSQWILPKGHKKRGQWNGKIRLYNKRTCYLPAGLLKYLILFAKERNYNLDFAPGFSSGIMNAFSLEEAKEYITGLNIHSKGIPLDIRDYQIVGVAKSIRYKRALLLSPTSSGKSLMMYCIARYLLEQKQLKKGIIIVPTINLVDQLKSDFEDYAHGTWNVDEHVHKIYAGEDKFDDSPLQISTWQSLAGIEDLNFFTKFDFVIGDEAHNFKAASLQKILNMMLNAQYRITMTGTLDDYKVHKLQIEGLFGPHTKLTTTKKMMEENQVAQLSIKALILKHPPESCKKAKKLTYREEMDFIVSSEKRNKFIANLALSLKGNTLILFQLVKRHGMILESIIKEKIKLKYPERKIFFIHGLTPGEERESIRNIVENEKDAIIVASYGTFSTGVNIRNLHNVVFSSPSKSKIRVLQSIGRGLRLSNNKTDMTLYDISDDLRIDKYINKTLEHFLARIKIYKSEQFKVSNYNIEL